MFKNKKIRITGTVISALLIAGITVFAAMNPLRYSTEILDSVDGEDLTEEYEAALADDTYGDVSVGYMESTDSYMVHADFRRRGRTELIVKTPDGTVKRYDLIIDLYSYEIKEIE